MTIYTVMNNETDYRENFSRLSDAKKAMKENNATGHITKIYSNGDWIYCGEIELKKSNKVFIANSPKQMFKSNY